MPLPVMDTRSIILGPLTAETAPSSLLDSKDRVVLLTSCLFFSFFFVIEVFVPSDLAYKALTRKLQYSARFWIDKWWVSGDNPSFHTANQSLRSAPPFPFPPSQFEGTGNKW